MVGFIHQSSGLIEKDENFEYCVTSGSEEYEVQRLEDLLQGHEQSSEDVIPVLLSSSTTLRLSRQVIMTRSDNCHILVFRSVLLCFVCVCHCLITIVTCIVFGSVLLCFVCVIVSSPL